MLNRQLFGGAAAVAVAAPALASTGTACTGPGGEGAGTEPRDAASASYADPAGDGGGAPDVAGSK